MSQLILDTGPLVALFDIRDTYHQWSKKTIQSFQPPMLTCEAVISETCFILQRIASFQVKQVFLLLEQGAIQIAFDLSQEYLGIQKLMEKYASVPMSVADACLVRMSDLFPQAKVFTLDSDFSIYRQKRNKTIPLIKPD